MRGHWRSSRPVRDFHCFFLFVCSFESSLILLTFNISRLMLEAELTKIMCSHCFKQLKPKWLGDLDSLEQHWGRARILEARGGKKEYLSRRLKGGGKKPWEAPGSFFSLQPEEAGPKCHMPISNINKPAPQRCHSSVCTYRCNAVTARSTVHRTQRTWEKNKIFEKILLYL